MPESAACGVRKASAGPESEDEEEHGTGDHSNHGDEDHSGHTEFHAEYLLTCADPAAISTITFAYFDIFPNALELEIQAISDTDATAFEVERDVPVLDLRNMY